MIALFLSLLFGSARADQVAVMSAVEFPQPLTLGVQYRSDQMPAWDAYAKTGFFSYPFSSSSRSVSIYSMEVGARYHPFLNGFYVASGLGFRKLGITVDISNLKQDGVSLANTAVANVGTVYTGIQLGHEWRLSAKVALAVDLGIQFALLHSGGITIETDPAQSDGTDNSVSDRLEMNRISGLPLPQIAVLRFLWYL